MMRDKLLLSPIRFFVRPGGKRLEGECVRGKRGKREGELPWGTVRVSEDRVWCMCCLGSGGWLLRFVLASTAATRQGQGRGREMPQGAAVRPPDALFMPSTGAGRWLARLAACLVV